MRYFDGRRLYSASDLNRFLECRHCTWLDLLDLDNPQERTAADEQLQLLREKGFEHERAYLAKLQAEGLAVVEIPSNQTLVKRAEGTRAAIAAGADVIYQAAMLGGETSRFIF